MRISIARRRRKGKKNKINKNDQKTRENFFFVVLYFFFLNVASIELDQPYFPLVKNLKFFLNKIAEQLEAQRVSIILFLKVAGLRILSRRPTPVGHDITPRRISFN